MSDRVVPIEALTAAGEGVARVDGVAVRLEGALPGERWRIRRERGAWVADSRESGGDEGVAPRCPVFGQCGGCTWQHASIAVQRAARLERVRRALPDGLRSVPIEYVPSDVDFGYRTRARLHWITAGGRVLLGFLARRSSTVVDLPGCPVLVAPLSSALATLQEALTAVGGRGEASLALGEGGRPVVSLRPSTPLPPAGWALGATLVAQGFGGVALWSPGATAPVVAGDPTPVQTGGDGLPLRTGVGGFAQAHGSLNLALAAYVEAEARAEGRALVELYAGAGNLTVRLARRATRVTAVESDRDAVKALRANLLARGLENVTLQHEAVEAREKPWRADVVVLDPPRAGAREASTLLAKAPVRRVVYVSCDPESLGRDLGVLTARYTVERLSAFEMFPQTPLVEVVATLAQTRGRAAAEGDA